MPLVAGNAGEQKPGGEMRRHEQDRGERCLRHPGEGGGRAGGDQKQDDRGRACPEGQGSVCAEERKPCQRGKTEEEGEAALPGAENRVHAGFTPILRSTMRAPSPTIVTSMAASTEPAISA